VNIVIPYRPSNNGLELKYALRSIEKNLTGYGEVFIVSDRPPKWITNVHTLLLSEETEKNSRNIVNKMLFASNRREVGENFIRWDDDIYLNKPLDVKDFKYWYQGTLADAIFQHRNNVRYRKYIENTAMKITDREFYYDIHTPIVYNKEKLKNLTKYDWSTFYLSKTMYCHHAGVEGVEMEDGKLVATMTEKEIIDYISGRLFFCTSPHSISSAAINVLESLYPNPSKYE